MPGFELIDYKEKEAVLKIFENGAVFFRHGFDNLRNNIYEVEAFEKDFSSYIGSNFSLAVTSGTAALRVALAAIDIQPGDEVITQSFTFVATVEAIVESGGTPVIVNIDKNLDMDIKDLENKITHKTKCIIPVHMLGTPSDMLSILDIAKKNKLFVIEDVAWGLGGSIKNKKLGNLGDIGTFSFDHAKSITTGEGGMLCFNNKKLFEKAKAWHDHGHQNNPKYPRWEDTRLSSGFNFRMNEIQAAIGRVQLKKLDKLIDYQLKQKKILSEIIGKYDLIVRQKNFQDKETADSFIFFADSKKTALLIKKCFMVNGINTKILPEAITWHFAGEFSHIKSLRDKYGKKLKQELSISLDNLSKAISLPIMINNNNLNTKVEKALKVFFTNPKIIYENN